MPLPSQGLAFEQSFCNFHIEPDVEAKLILAAEAFHKGKLTESANLFLCSYRILRSEFERNCHTLQDSSPKQNQTLIRQNKKRKLLSFIALHDLGRACSRNNDEYRYGDGEFKLEIYALRNGWSELSIATDIRMKEGDETKSWQQGRSVALLLPLYDPIGRLLKEASSFKDAAVAISKICSLQIACISNPPKEQEAVYNFITNSMMWIRPRLSTEAALTKAAKFNSSRFTKMQEQNKDNEVKKTPKIFAPKVELKSKRTPSGIEKVDEISRLVDQFTITPYSGLEFRQMQKRVQEEEKSDSSEGEMEEEEGSDSFEGEMDESFVGLLDQFHITDRKESRDRETISDSDSTL